MFESDETKNFESHYVAPTHRQEDDFDGFFEVRRRELLNRMGGVMGNRLLIDPTEPTPEPDLYDEVEDEDTNQ